MKDLQNQQDMLQHHDLDNLEIGVGHQVMESHSSSINQGLLDEQHSN